MNWIRTRERFLVDGIFGLLLTGILLLGGWLGARWETAWDWTWGTRNTLAPATRDVIARLQGPVRLTVFLDAKHPQRKFIDALLARYRAAGAQITQTYRDPQRYPDRARAAGISTPGQALVEYRNRRERIDALTESELTGALARLSRSRRTWILVLEGHGERRLTGGAPEDLGRFGQLLGEQGYGIRALDLTDRDRIPTNVDLLILSNPFIPLFPGEVDRLIAYLRGGGNLLWLMDPGPLNGLEPLAAFLGVKSLPGVLMDANAQRLHLENPRIVLVPEDSDPLLTRGLEAPALFPETRAYAPSAAPGWTLETPLKSLPRTWNETGPIRGTIRRDPEAGEREGPLPVALALRRHREGGAEQRVLILGDGDFLSNAALEQGANRTLGLRLIRWLITPENGRVPEADGEAASKLLLTDRARLLVGGSTLVGFPLLFLLAGLLIRWRRRRA